MEREKLLNKLIKLNRLAENAGSPAEATAALQKISLLMDQYTIAQAELDEFEEPRPLDQRMTSARYYVAKKAPLKWISQLALYIQLSTSCESVYSEKQRFVEFYGLSENVEESVKLTESLTKAMRRNATHVWKLYRAQGLTTRGLKSSYYMGFVQGVGHGVLEIVKNRESLPDSEQTALIRVGNAAREYVDDQLKGLTVKSGKTPTSSRYHDSGYTQGRRDGYAEFQKTG